MHCCSVHSSWSRNRIGVPPSTAAEPNCTRRWPTSPARGYYRYDDTGRNRLIDETVHALIEQATTERGLTRRSFDDEEIHRRALLAIVNEAAQLLGEGVAERATDIDAVMVNGYGFPRWEGGPVFWARQRGGEALSRDIDWLAQLSGPGFVRGDVVHLLASHGKTV